MSALRAAVVLLVLWPAAGLPQSSGINPTPRPLEAHNQWIASNNRYLKLNGMLVGYPEGLHRPAVLSRYDYAVAIHATTIHLRSVIDALPDFQRKIAAMEPGKERDTFAASFQDDIRGLIEVTPAIRMLTAAAQELAPELSALGVQFSEFITDLDAVNLWLTFLPSQGVAPYDNRFADPPNHSVEKLRKFVSWYWPWALDPADRGNFFMRGPPARLMVARIVLRRWQYLQNYASFDLAKLQSARDSIGPLRLLVQELGPELKELGGDPAGMLNELTYFEQKLAAAALAIDIPPVPQNYGAFELFAQAKRNGVLIGYPDGQRGNRAPTVGELLAAVVRTNESVEATITRAIGEVRTGVESPCILGDLAIGLDALAGLNAYFGDQLLWVHYDWRVGHRQAVELRTKILDGVPQERDPDGHRVMSRILRIQRLVAKHLSNPDHGSRDHGTSRYESALAVYVFREKLLSLVSGDSLKLADRQMLSELRPLLPDLREASIALEPEFRSLGFDPITYYEMVRDLGRSETLIYRLLGTAAFRDVPADHWAADAIQDLANKGLLRGYPNGRFGG
ncbi:MAG TPA: S-layer homology domain-containing protein [Fimbriimonadaceae bacterium]|nr:S-layer homology domain-containing protein [Fimbriimonadaceae bacterium]